MDRIGSRRSRGNGSLQSGVTQRHSSPKRNRERSTQEAARAWVESLEIRQLLSASDLAVTMTGPQSAPIGGQAFYQVIVTNNGPDDVQGVVTTFGSAIVGFTPSQQLPSAKATQISGPQGGTLPAGSSESFQVIQSLPAFEGAPSYSITESATANGPTNSDPIGSNNTATVTTKAVSTTNLKAVVAAPSAIPIGQNNVTFDITVTNFGPNEAQNVVLTDLLPSQLNFVSAVQTSGAAVFNLVSATPGTNSPVTAMASSMPLGSATIQITAANPSPVLYQVLTNQVTISGQTVNGPAVATGSQDSIEWKYATNLSMGMTGNFSSVLAGSYIDPTYTVSVTDLGVTFPSSASLTYTIPSGFTLASVSGPSNLLPAVGSKGTLNIPISSAGTFEFTEAVDPSIPNATQVVHSAIVTTTPDDNDPSDNSASVTTTVYDGSDVAIAMKRVPTVLIGGQATYQITVSDLGPSTAANVNFSDILPTGLTFYSLTQTSGPHFFINTPAPGGTGTIHGQVGTMLPGSATFTLVANVSSTLLQYRTVTNTASVSTSSAGDVASNNTVSVQSTAENIADLSLTASGEADPIIGTKTHYDLTVTNTGPGTAWQILIADTLPQQLAYPTVEELGNNVPYYSMPATQGNGVQISVSSLLPGQSATFEITAWTGGNDGAKLINSASVSSYSIDPNSTNNTAEVDSTALAVADLAVSLSLPTQIIGNGDGEQPPVPQQVLVAGDLNVIDVNITNNGPSPAGDTKVLLSLPAGATFNSALGGPTTVQTINGVPTVVLDLHGVATTYPNQPQTVVIRYTLDPSTAESVVTETATLQSVTLDPNLGNNSASATVTVSKPGDLAPTIYGPTIARAGTLASYVLSVSNDGDLNAGGGIVTFNIPDNAPLVSISGSDFAETPDVIQGTTGPIAFTLYQGLAPGQGQSVTILERIDPSVPDGSTIVPTATVAPLKSDDDPSDNSTSLTTNVIAQADVSVAMTGPANITAGTNATYTITVSNNGPSDAQSVTFLDDLPAGMTFVSLAQTSGAPFSLLTPTPGAVGTASGTGTLPAGTSAVFQLVGMLQPNVQSAVTNTVSVSTTTAGDNPNNNSASVTSNVVTSADLAVSLSEPDQISPGGSSNYEIVVSNNGPSDATSVVVESMLPASEAYRGSEDLFNGKVAVLGAGPYGQTIVYTIADLPAGESDRIDIQFSVDPLAPPIPISNNASAISATPDPDTTNNSASASVLQVVTEADLSVDLSSESSSPPFLAGDTGELEVAVSNGGPTYAQNVVVTDTLPQGASLVSITPRGQFNVSNLPAAGSTGTLSWAIPLLTAGSGEGFDLVYRLSQASEVPSLTDSATVSSSTRDFNLSNNSATLQFPTIQPAELIVSGPPFSRAGTSAEYGFTLDTEGDSAGWRVLTIDVPQGATISAISPPNGYVLPSGLIGASGIISFPIFVPAEDNVAFVVSETTPSSMADGTILTNSAWVNFDTSTTQSVSTKILAQADIAASVTGPSAIVPGTAASYTLKVTNNGPSDARNVTFNDAVPPGTTFQSMVQTSGPAFGLNLPLVRSGGTVSGSIPTLLPGASASFTLTASVPSDLSATSLTDTLNVATDTTDLNSSNNSASVTTPVQPQADLSVALSSGIGRAVAGTGFTYSITVINAGPSMAQNVVLSEVLAPGVVFSSFGFGSGTYTASGPHPGANGTVTFQIASIPVHGFYTYSVNVAVPSNTPAGPLPSTANVTSSTADPNTANNTATDTITQAVTSADVQITDTPPMMFIDNGTTNSPPVLHPVFMLRQNNTWVVDVTNAGPSDAQNVAWTSAVPTGVMLESVSQVSGPAFALTTPTGGTGTVTGNIATLPAGQTAEFDLVFAQNGIAAGDTISDTATVTSDTADPNKFNNTSTGTAQAYAPGDLAVSVQGPAVFRAGTYVNYIIDVTNVGQLLAGSATLVFDIPSNAPLNMITSSSGFPTLPNLSYGTTGPVSFTLPAGMVTGGDANIALQLFIEPDVPNGAILAPTATLTNTLPLDDPSNNTASGNTRILAQGDLAVKQTGPASVVPGATATYTFTIANNGPSYSQNVSFSDPLPAGMTFVSLTQSGSIFTLNPLPVGASGSVSGSIATLRTGALTTFTLVTMLPPSASGASLTNTVTATADTTDLNSTNNSASVTSAISPQADLAVSLVGGTATAGGNLTYTLTVTNNGPSDAQNVVLTQALPAGTGFNSIVQLTGPASGIGGPHVGGGGNAVASIPTLPAGKSATYQVNVSVFPSTPAGQLPSTLSVTSTTPDANLANNTFTDIMSTVATRADLRVSELPPMMIVDAGSTTSPPMPKPVVVVGQNNTFIIDITNAGPSDAQNVSWSSAVPTGLSLVSVTQASGPAFVLNLPSGGTGTIAGNIATLPAGQTAEFDVVYLANGVSAGATVASTVSATSDTADTNKTNNTVTANTTAYAPPDLAVSVQGPSVFRAGTYITYILDVTNDGGIPAGGATITYNIPDNAPLDSITGSSGFPTLPNPPAGTTGPITFTLPSGMVPGGDANVTIREFISPSMADGSILAPTATLSGLPTSDDPSNNTAAGNTRILAQGDLAVTQTGPATIVPGTDITYNFKITNNGPSDAQNVSFSDPLPADLSFESIVQNTGPTFTLVPPQGQTENVTGNIATLPAGASASFTLVALLSSSASGGNRTNTVTATSGTTDLNTANNAASVTSTISPQADLSVTIASGIAPAGGSVTYTLTVTNNGPSDAQNVVLNQTLPTDISYSFMTQSVGPTSSFGPDANWNVVVNIASLPVGTFAIYQVHAMVAYNASAGPAPSTLSVTSSTTDPNPSNNSVTDTESPITFHADLAAYITAPFQYYVNGGTDGVIAGQNNTFTIAVANNGPSEAQNVSWRSDVPAGLSLVSVTQVTGPASVVNVPSGSTGTITGNIAILLPGQSAAFDVVYLANGVSAGGSVVSSVSVTSDTTDDNPANNTAAGNTPVVHPADLAVTLEGPSNAYAGQYSTYTLDVTNDQPVPAGSATITFNIPDNAPFYSFGQSNGFPTLPNVPAGTTGPITLTLPAGLRAGTVSVGIIEHILPSVASGTVLGTTASLSGLPDNDDPSNNAASVNTTVQTLADLGITQTGPATVTAGAVANYQVTVTNNGFSDSQNVSFVETLPQGVDAQVAGIVQDSGPAFTLNGKGGSIGTLPTGASATFTVSVEVGSDVAPGTVLTATAAVSASTTDLNTSNNSAATNTTVQAAQPSIIAVPAADAGPFAKASPIHGFGRTIHTTLAGFSGVVAQFVDPTPIATALHFHVAINWGDGNLSAGTVTYDKVNRRWDISGSHRYQKKGVYTITVIVQDSAGRQGTITSHAIVGPVLVTPLTKQLV